MGFRIIKGGGRARFEITVIPSIFFANYRITSKIFHEIKNFSFRDVSEIPNIEKILLKLPYHCQKIFKYHIP